MVIQRCCQWIHGDSMGISWKYNDLIGLNHQFDLILDENWLFLPFRLTTISELDLAVLHFFLVLLTLHPCVPLYPQRTITLDQCLRSNFLFIHNKNGRTPAIYGKDWDGLLAFFLHLFFGLPHRTANPQNSQNSLDRVTSAASASIACNLNLSA